MKNDGEFKILPYLPATGPLPEQFSASGRGTHREGFVVEFFPEGRTNWVGNFQRGATGYNAVMPYIGGTSLVVFAGGQAYVIDPVDRRPVRTFGGDIEEAITIASPSVLVVATAIGMESWGAAGLIWQSRRISWDGMREIRVEADKIRGEAWCVLDECYYPFAVDLATGSVVGGSYDRPSVS